MEEQQSGKVGKGVLPNSNGQEESKGRRDLEIRGSEGEKFVYASLNGRAPFLTGVYKRSFRYSGCCSTFRFGKCFHGLGWLDMRVEAMFSKA